MVADRNLQGSDLFCGLLRRFFCERFDRLTMDKGPFHVCREDALVLRCVYISTIGWFFAITIMLSMARSYELSFVLDIPHAVDNLKNMATNAFTFPRAQNDDDMEAPSLTDRVRKISWDMFSYMSTWLNSMSRRTNNYEQMKPNVEVGPGVVKSEIVSHPPNYFVNRLKYLLQMKQREEEDHTPPNKQEK